VPQTDELPIFRSHLQPRVLGLLLLNPQQTWTSRDLADRLEATPVSIHRELHRALSGGLITRKSVGRTYIYRAATESPLYEPLCLLLERTIGIEIELRRALQGTPGVDAAFIHGSYAKKTKLRPTSDVDVFVLGEVDPRLLRKNLRRVESRVGREVDVLAYTSKEFAALLESGNSLARSIARGPLTPLIGSIDALRAA
jgi:predicted nucleotidyltransferase